MKPVLVKKAYLPTLEESDLTLDDITSLRWIPSYRRNTFNMQQPVRRNISNIDWETRLMGEEGKKPLPGFAEGRNLTGYFLNPAVRMGALHGDVTFNDKGTLMGIAEKPHFWRTPQQGAANMSIAGEGFRYNQLPKEAFVDLQADYSPVDAQRALLEWERGQRMEGKKASESFDDLATSFPEVYDIASILPDARTENIWGQPAILSHNPLTDFDASQYKVASEPMDIAFQLLKEDPLHLQSSNTLARRAREELETDAMGQNSPAYQEMMERLMEMYEPQDETIPLEENLDQYAQESGKNPWRMLPGREIPNKYGGTAKVHLDPLTPIHPQQFYDWQAKNASEPMDIALQLLKERVSPEAKRHKLEYDKKYESSPERVKYREELNRERRRRGIYGSHDHKDISHTEGGKLTLEGEHENRARHFKDKGTLREL
tara:strand:+ start:3990 stop:5282 length:1293 start_codon:yes stop_codon:yes gene_type:complete